MPRIETVDLNLERQRLFAETAVLIARLDAELLDGTLDQLAAAGDRLLRAAELEKRGSPESAGL